MKKISIKQLAQKYETAKTHINRNSALHITNNQEIIADGCKKVVSCDDCMVVLKQVHNRVTIIGVGLRLRNWGSEGVTIYGKINSVEFDEETP